MRKPAAQHRVLGTLQHGILGEQGFDYSSYRAAAAPKAANVLCVAPQRQHYP